MRVNRTLKINIIAGLIMNVIVSASMTVSAQDHPSIAAGVPFFYYQNLSAAAAWYKNKLGLKPLTEEDWVVIFELTPTSYIGLVNASGGSLKPSDNKGALLSIETAELKAWWNRLKEVDGINMIHGIQEGADGMIEEFRMYDPEGYMVEFFRWKAHRVESSRYKK